MFAANGKQERKGEKPLRQLKEKKMYKNFFELIQKDENISTDFRRVLNNNERVVVDLKSMKGRVNKNGEQKYWFN